MNEWEEACNERTSKWQQQITSKWQQQIAILAVISVDTAVTITRILYRQKIAR